MRGMAGLSNGLGAILAPEPAALISTDETYAYHGKHRLPPETSAMPDILRPLGILAGLAGLTLCLIAGGIRLAGSHWWVGFETVTLLQIGIGGMVLGCFCLLIHLSEPVRRP